MSIKIATPISTLFTDEESTRRISSLSDALEIRNPLKPVPPSEEYLYHAEESIVVLLTDEEIERIVSVINKHKVDTVSFHVASCFQRPKLIGGVFYPNGAMMTEAEMLSNARVNMKKLRARAGIKKYIIENNNYFNTGAYETVTEPLFLSTLMSDLNIGLLLDIGHARVSSHHTGISFEHYVNKLPLDKILQIHFSSPTLKKDKMKDTHRKLTLQDWNHLKETLNLTKNIRHITIEYYKNLEILESMLKTLRLHINQYHDQK
jgi:uncharacterized protein (UPF0276 family)